MQIPGRRKGFHSRNARARVRMNRMRKNMDSNKWTLTIVGVSLDGKVAVKVEAVDVPEVT